MGRPAGLPRNAETERRLARTRFRRTDRRRDLRPTARAEATSTSSAAAAEEVPNAGADPGLAVAPRGGPDEAENATSASMAKLAHLDRHATTAATSGTRR